MHRQRVNYAWIGSQAASSLRFMIYDIVCIDFEWRSRKLTPTRKSKKNKNQDIDSSKNIHWPLSGLFEIINMLNTNYKTTIKVHVSIHQKMDSLMICIN